MLEQVKVTIKNADGIKRDIWTYTGKNLWDVLAAHGYDTGGTCGGAHVCGKCKLKVQGQASEMGLEEKEKLLPEEIKNGMRLACYCTVEGHLEVYLDDNRAVPGKAGIQLFRNEADYDQIVSNRQIFIAGLDKSAPVPIHTRIIEAMPDCIIDITAANLNELQALDRPGRPSIELQTLIMDQKYVKYVGKKTERAYGVALDIGTTTLFAALVDLETGETAAVASGTNMQRIYGADVISRVGYCKQNSEGLEKLHQILINNINTMLEELMKKAALMPRQIYRLTAVGNPVMLHFLARVNVDGFSEAPYTGLFSEEFTLKGFSMGLRVNPDAIIYILPQIAGFVGADTVACLLTLENRPDSRYLMIDIGTNGEVVLFNRGDIWAASAAAGPAFEGAGITSGTRAGNGSIDRFFINEAGAIDFTVIGQRPVKGICGSAVIDLIACLLRSNCIDQNGIITDKAGDYFKVINGQRGPEMVLYEGEDIVKGNPIVFNQEDIRQVQLAKAAVRTAVDVLLAKARLSHGDLDNIYLAGTFGSFLSPENSIEIGLLPSVNADIVKNIGNAAGEGAVRALLSSEVRNEAGRIKDKVNYVELALHPDFQSRFIDNLQLNAY